MSTRYSVFIDESGHAGITKVRSSNSSGASPYMTLGAVLVEDSDIPSIQTTLQGLAQQLGKKSLHCAQLGHYQLVHFARTIKAHNIVCFGVISYKATLGDYKAQIQNDPRFYYNKCVQYLMERIGLYLQAEGIPSYAAKIIFEQANVNYAAMKRFLRTCQQTPFKAATSRINHIDINNIDISPKSSGPLLQLADLVAHALFKCVDKSPNHYDITEVRYLRELKDKFFKDPESNKVLGAGIYCIHSINSLNLDPDVHTEISGW